MSASRFLYKATWWGMIRFPSIPIFEGANTVGRCNLSVTDKRVSRKHISLHASTDGSIEVLVEGPNPIIVRSGGERKKICSQEKVTIANGDIMELIPGNYSFKYATFGNENTTSSPTDSSSKKGKRHSEEDSLASNFAQDNATVSDISGSSQSKPANTIDSKMDKVHPLSIPKEWLPLIFRLMRVQGLPAWANSSSVTIQDVIQGNVLVAVLSNYMVDIDWLLSACPDLKKIPHVLVVHGEGGASLERLQKTKPPNWILHKPPLPISYGTHHSKAMLLVYPQGIRVVVHTANLIYVDWNNKTQGLWMQDFPWKDVKVNNRECSFENDLVDYLRTLKWPEFSVKLPAVGNVAINAAFFKKFDYSSATVRLIASVPGYHMGPNLKKWGHMKMRTVLNEHIFDKEFHKSPLVYQFSSLGSLDERWLNEFASSMSSGTSDDGSPLGIGKPLIIWPTVEDVRCSLEGYAAGNAIPSPQKNVEKDFLKKYWARWKADHMVSADFIKFKQGSLGCITEEQYATYDTWVYYFCRPWFILNHISRAQEIVPSTPLNEFKTKLATLCLNRSSGTDSSSQVIRLPVPFRLPPQPYTSEDVPWSWDRRYTKKDVYGQVWPRHVQLYTSDDS
ncbi:Tyrosyl-DNA phosphodiesterase 1 [Ananas comosus]|uniref:Tyrosyl-DNA phosphodiesterase 1 n=1 Tax=Ananas comosus TaxID=4615 RepID=A0A199URL3_ANACO|nr:Tyrosyl-DNA phosphodiesterase 1 [Ananas comosus]